MTEFTIYDIVSRCTTMGTIWCQELNQTKDVELLKKLLDAYVQSAMINLSDEASDYASFYRDVLKRFEESV